MIGIFIFYKITNFKAIEKTLNKLKHIRLKNDNKLYCLNNNNISLRLSAKKMV